MLAGEEEGGAAVIVGSVGTAVGCVWGMLECETFLAAQLQSSQLLPLFLRVVPLSHYAACTHLPCLLCCPPLPLLLLQTTRSTTPM